MKIGSANEEGLLKDNFTFFEAIFSYKSPKPERRKAACKTPILQAKRALFSTPFQLDRVNFSTPDKSVSAIF